MCIRDRSKSNTVSVVLSINGYDFNASGTQLAFDGYLKMVSDYESSKDVLLPDLSEGQQCTPVSLLGNQHFTEPPLRYSEARLIKEMEEEGIGRPSTYSMIIDTIQQLSLIHILTNINQVERYKGCELAVDQEALPPLAEGEYYFFQLKGLKAIDPQGNELGTVVRMEASAAQNLIRLKKPDGKQALIPYIDVFVKQVDLQAKTITLDLIEGML